MKKQILTFGFLTFFLNLVMLAPVSAIPNGNDIVQTKIYKTSEIVKYTSKNIDKTIENYLDFH